MLTIITLPETFVADITSNMSTLIGDLSPYLTLIIGTLLAMALISYLVGLFMRG